MRTKPSWGSVVVLLALSTASGQTAGIGRTDVGNLRVRVTDMNDRPAGGRAHVELMTSGGMSPVQEGFCNQDGMIQFNGVSLGTYHLVISGDGIERTDSGPFEVDARKNTQSLFVKVKFTRNLESESTGSPGSVDALSLGAPKRAVQEFDKASTAMEKKDWQGAIEHLRKAIETYPKYVAAYNNLAAAYSHVQDHSREREALQKAVSLDDHFALSLVNLGRVYLIDKNFSEAEDLFNKAVALEPNNLETLILLARAQFLAKHFDQVVATELRVHSLPHHEKYAVVHYIAAHAFESIGNGKNAVAEFQTFLAEQPTGAQSDVVRKELVQLQGHLSSMP